MQSVDFEQRNVIIGENQPEYVPLYGHIDTEDVQRPATICLQLDIEEIRQILNNGGKLWFTQCTFGKGYNPIRMSVTNPFPS